MGLVARQANLVIRGLELAVPPQPLSRGEELEMESIANDQ